MVGRNVRVKFILRESERGLQARSGGELGGGRACSHVRAARLPDSKI